MSARIVVRSSRWMRKDPRTSSSVPTTTSQRAAGVANGVAAPAATSAEHARRLSLAGREHAEHLDRPSSARGLLAVYDTVLGRGADAR